MYDLNFALLMVALIGVLMIIFIEDVDVDQQKVDRHQQQQDDGSPACMIDPEKPEDSGS